MRYRKFPKKRRELKSLSLSCQVPTSPVANEVSADLCDMAEYSNLRAIQIPVYGDFLPRQSIICVGMQITTLKPV